MLGKQAEDLALNWLIEQNLKLVTQNFHAKGGEIDLIMLDDNILVFVEVRYRKQSKYGSAVESVNWRKQQRIIVAAQYFLVKNSQWQNHDCRFDVVVFEGNNSPQWFKSAFNGV